MKVIDELLPEEFTPVLECEHCGELTEELREVADCDPSTGYHSSLNVCPACYGQQRPNRCGSCR